MIAPRDYPGARALRGDRAVPGLEMRHTSDGGREFWTNVAAVPTYDDAGAVTGAMTVINDITQRKHAEAALRESEARQVFLLRLSDALRPLADPVEIQTAAARLLGELLDASRVFYVTVARDGDTADIRGDYVNGVASRTGRYSLAAFSKQAVKEWRAGRVASTSDIEADPRYDEDERAAFAAVSTRAGFGVPLIKEGRLAALLGVNQSTPRDWTGQDIDRAREVAERTWAEVERARAEAALRHAEERQRALIEGMPQLVWRAAGGGDWTWASRQWSDYTGQSLEQSRGRGWLDAVHPDDRDAALAAWASAEEGDGFDLEYRIRRAADDSYRWFRTRATPLHGGDGAVIEWLGTSTDVDETRALQKRQEVLVAELQHRVRNMLTVVRSVFTRTVENGSDLGDVADHFTGRLDALARTQVIVTRTADGQADLENLIRDELLSVGLSDGDKFRIGGPDVTLPSKTAESIGLAIHELTTNALKYGALKVPGATLEIGWTINMDQGDARRLTLTWHEQGVPAIPAKPTREGFGRELIEEALPYRLGAETKLEFLGGGVRCTISVPLSGGDEGREDLETGT